MKKKEKVILWGSGNIYRQQYHEIKKLIENGTIEIQALVSREAKETQINGHKVIKKEELQQFSYDRIVIMADAKAAASILQDIKSLKIKEEKVIDIFAYLVSVGNLSSGYGADVRNQIDVLHKILNASDAEVKDYDWMYRMINEYGIYDFGRREHGVNYTQWGILQVPHEFAAYCNFIADFTIDTAIEIGVAKGRSSYFMCALLSRKNQNLKYVLVDIYDGLDNFEFYREVLPALEKRIPSTSEEYKENRYDFVFIDADHSYPASMRDYRNVGQYANKLTVFHDIYAHEYDGQDGGTVRTWQEVLELTQDKEHKIFSKYPNEWMGIGCIIQ